MMLHPQSRGKLRDALSVKFASEDLFDLVVYQIGRAGAETAFAWNKKSKDLARDIVEAAYREDWLPELLVTARKERPRSEEIFRLATEAELSSVQPSALQRMITAAAGYTAPRTLIEGLARTEYHVCKIEVRREDGAIIEGSGFLVGNDRVLTNYHVMRALLDSPDHPGDLARPENVSVTFDYRRLPGAKRPSPGTTYELAPGDNWNLDSSPPSNWERKPVGPPDPPTEEQLDYALLCLATAPGKEKVGGSDKAELRGFVEMPDPIPRVRSGSVVYILQHPRGRELALSHDLVIAEENRRIRYQANTDNGSSGAPCFDQGWRLVAIHNSGIPTLLSATGRSTTRVFRSR